MRAVVGAKEIIRAAEIGIRKYETTGIKLTTNNGKLIYETRAFKFLEDVSRKEFFNRIKGERGFFIAKEGGREKLFSFTRSKGYRDFEGHDWIFVVGHDTDEVLKPTVVLRNRIVVASLILIAISIAAAFLMSRSMTKPLAKLTKGAEIIGKGYLEHRVDIKAEGEIGILANAFNKMVTDLKQATAPRDDLNNEIAERKRAENQIKSSLREKEVLLREIHHRVKNNLAVISGLLSMQANQLEDGHVRAALQESQNRVMTMALIHESLYQSESLTFVDLERYMKGLVGNLMSAFDGGIGRVRFDVEARGVKLEVNQAEPCGLIINELVTNALKHAFADGQDGMERAGWIAPHLRSLGDVRS